MQAYRMTGKTEIIVNVDAIVCRVLVFVEREEFDGGSGGVVEKEITRY